MSRIAKVPIIVPVGVDVEIKGQSITIKSKHGELTRIINNAVKIQYEDRFLYFSAITSYTDGWAQAGTARSLLNSMIIGLTKGFIKKLQLVGVGYRAEVKNNALQLSVGLSHMINYQLPENITIECVSPTEIIIKGIDKQLVSQVASDIRSYRRPEPYKGKGICYSGEAVRIKETKKK